MNPTLGQRLGRIFVSSFVMGFCVLVLRVILTSLPMIKNAGMIGDTSLPVILVLRVVLDAAIMAVVMLMALQIRQAIETYRPDLADLGMVLLLFFATVVAAYAYNSFQLIQFVLVPDLTEAYNWLFVLLVLGLLALVAATVVRRLEFFTNLLYNGFANAGSVGMTPAVAVPFGAPPAQGGSQEAAMWRTKFEELTRRIEQARHVAATRPLGPEMQQAAANMQNYMRSAQDCSARADWAEANRCLAWAEYEAGRVTAALGM